MYESYCDCGYKSRPYNRPRTFKKKCIRCGELCKERYTYRDTYVPDHFILPEQPAAPKAGNEQEQKS